MLDNVSRMPFDANEGEETDGHLKFLKLLKLEKTQEDQIINATVA